MDRTVGWLLRRVGATLVALFAVEVFLLLVALAVVAATSSPHALVPAWLNMWVFWGLLVPFGIGVVGLMAWGAKALVNYWRKP